MGVETEVAAVAAGVTVAIETEAAAGTVAIETGGETGKVVLAGVVAAVAVAATTPFQKQVEIYISTLKFNSPKAREFFSRFLFLVVRFRTFLDHLGGNLFWSIQGQISLCYHPINTSVLV